MQIGGITHIDQFCEKVGLLVLILMKTSLPDTQLGNVQQKSVDCCPISMNVVYNVMLVSNTTVPKMNPCVVIAYDNL